MKCDPTPLEAKMTPSRLQQIQTWLDLTEYCDLSRLQMSDLIFFSNYDSGSVSLNVIAAVAWLLSQLIVSTFRNRYSLFIKLLRSNLLVCEKESNFSWCSEGSTSVANWNCVCHLDAVWHTLLNKHFQWSDTFTFTHNRLHGVFNLCNGESQDEDVQN